MLSDVKVLEVEPRFKEERFRVPLKFGTGLIRTITSFTVRVKVETRGGRTADGWGNILLSDLWGFPSAVLSHEQRDRAMREVSLRYARMIEDYGRYAHPIDLYMETKSGIEPIADGVGEQLHLEERMPLLGALVCASAVDAAVHDAFGKANEMSSYTGYGAEFMAHDLSAFLGARYKGRYVADYLQKRAAPALPIFHLVGGMDKLRRDEVDEHDPKDGLPVSLEEWIERDGVFCFKVKLKGAELNWDVDRMRQITAVVRDSRARMGQRDFCFSIDTNEQCKNPEYVIEFLHRLKTEIPAAFDAMLYVEQPTERDLEAHRFDMHALSAIKPVVADEGVTDVDKLDLARELGWSGVALKTCKGFSSALLYVAKAVEEGMVYTVQDLTNPGLSLIHSAGFAARINPLKGVEYNSRQYIPWADEPIRAAHPDLFTVRNGWISTQSICGNGLGYRR
ncbi:MAG: mandelate racemase/muconate lactonizing enzyme family protein [Candidatus Latescibacteria bacterium]|nr:mandelate racemase/muconate lactonizing enzyme family protein [Candidatus Latescibacterota bacterium]